MPIEPASGLFTVRQRKTGNAGEAPTSRDLILLLPSSLTRSRRRHPLGLYITRCNFLRGHRRRRNLAVIRFNPSRSPQAQLGKNLLRMLAQQGRVAAYRRRCR